MKKMAIRKKLKVSAIVVVCLFFVVFAFRKFNRNPKTGDENPPAEEVQDKAAETISTEAIPETYTTDFPIYDKAQFKESWVSNSEEGSAVSIVWESEEATGKVFEYYQMSLDSKGWETSNIKRSDAFATLSFTKDNKSGFLGITKGSGGKTVISVTIGIKDK